MLGRPTNLDNSRVKVGRLEQVLDRVIWLVLLSSILSIHFLSLSLGFGWLVVLGLTALCDSISVYIGASPKEREKEERKDS